LQSIEGSREVINSIQIPPEVEANIRRRSTLKSSLFSARIEGNTIDLDEISRLPSQDQRKVEVYNILKALNWIHQRAARDLTIKDVLNLHELALNSLIEKQNLGSFRTNFEAIFNSAGIAIYLPPRPVQVPPLLNRLLKYANSPKEPFIPIRACIAHYTFEKVSDNKTKLTYFEWVENGELESPFTLAVLEKLKSSTASSRIAVTIEISPDSDITTSSGVAPGNPSA